MNRSDILQRLQGLFRSVFGEDDIVVSEAMTAEDLEDWDSLANVRLMIAVEQAFSIKLKAPEIAALKNVGELVTLISGKAA